MVIFIFTSAYSIHPLRMSCSRMTSFMTFFKGNDAVIFYMTLNCGVMWFQLVIIVHMDFFLLVSEGKI